MKAAIRYRYGDAQVISIEDKEIPRPREDEILVRVAATTVNRTDCANLTGKPWIMHLVVGFRKPRKPVMGTDFSGTVVETGSGIRDFVIGDRVWGFLDIGLESQAEYVSISVKRPIARMPDLFNFREAAASLEGAHYAYHFINKLPISPGQRALVNGATGAIGSAILQFLLYKGVRVSAVCGPDGVDWVKSQGVDRIFDYTREDFTTSGEKYDFVLDAVGKSRFFKCRTILNPKGIYISSELGPGGQNLVFTLLTPLLGGRRVKFPLPVDVKASMRFVSQLAMEGKFKPLIDRTFALAQAREAYAYVLKGQKLGNVVLDVGNSEA